MAVIGQSGRRVRGVTLLEMLVVLAILSVALAVVAPSARAGISGIRARAAARQVAAVFSTARNLAIRRGTPVAVTVSEQQRLLRVVPAGGEPYRELELDEDIAITAAEPYADPAEFAAPHRDRVKSFAFFPDGEVPALSVALSAGNRTLRLRMDVLTGALTSSEE